MFPCISSLLLDAENLQIFSGAKLGMLYRGKIAGQREDDFQRF